MALPTIGWIGLGDQGEPIARAIAQAGYLLHVWARRPASLQVLDGVPFTAHDTIAELGATADIVALCLREDHDNRQVLTQGGLLDAMRPGTILVNHGTGLPASAVELTRQAAPHRIDVIDAPVSGGRAGALAKQLTTIVGGDPAAFARVQPVFDTFSKKVAYLGGPGAGQMGKLINNVLLMTNQKNIVDALDIATRMNIQIPELVEVLRSGTGSSTALQVLGTAITTDNAEHLSRLQLIDMDIFTEAVAGLGDSVTPVNQRAVEGAEALPLLASMVR